MRDLSHYQARVEAAVRTNQCLDYAEDVSELLAEVIRLGAGVTAAWTFLEEAYKRANSPSTHFSDLPALRTVQTVADGMWDSIGDAMGEGWRP